jgi:hypothetical protein
MKHEFVPLCSQELAISIYSGQDKCSPLYYTSLRHFSQIHSNTITPYITER